jgi:anti-sigma factor RsiW
MSDHEQLRDDVGAYLLGALDDHERLAFERHVDECADCRSELEFLRPAVQALPRSVEPFMAPERLKRSLFDAVREEAGPQPGARRARRRWRLALPRLTPVVAWSSAAFLVIVGIAVGFGLGNALSATWPQRSKARSSRARVARFRSPTAARTARSFT